MPNDRLYERRPQARQLWGHSRTSALSSKAEQRLRVPGPRLLGHSAATRRAQSQIHRAVRSNEPVLVVGAPGTGKRVVAEILHHYGGGETRELEAVEIDAHDCVESIGEFAYLNPLERLPLDEQARLPELTGSRRLIIGTRLDPESDEGKRRIHPAVLRWCGPRVVLPTLAERIDDLEHLALRIIDQTPARRPVGGLTEAALDRLRSYHWPGNVSELEEILHDSIAAGTTEQIELRDLPALLRLREMSNRPEPSPEERLSLAYAERKAVKRALEYARGNKRKAARLLQIGKTTLYRKIKAHKL